MFLVLLLGAGCGVGGELVSTEPRSVDAGTDAGVPSTDGGLDAGVVDAGVVDAGATSPSLAVSLSPPSPASGSVTTSFRFVVTPTGGAPVTVTAAQVVLAGPGATGCTPTITGSGTVNPLVTVANCAGHGPFTLRLTNCLVGTTPGCAAATGPSTSAIVSNPTADEPITIGGPPAYTYAGAAGRTLTYELYFPTDWASRANLPLYLHVHGGGWTGGDAADDAALGQLIAKRGFVVANLNYTLAPAYAPGSFATTPYTAGAEDIHAFVQFATAPSVLASIHVDPAKVSIGGTSAGAHLALWQATRSDNAFNFRCVAEAAGPTDLLTVVQQATLPITTEIVNGVFGATPPLAASPALNMSAFRGDRLLIMHSLHDNLVPVAQAHELAGLTEPRVELTRNYWPDPNPTPTMPNHALGAGAPLAFATWLESRCK